MSGAMMLKYVLLAPIAALAVAVGARLASHAVAAHHVMARIEDVPRGRAAVVFGAGTRNGSPTPMLYDRVATAVDLYRAGQVTTLVMSGDGRRGELGEPAVMKRTALQLGVPERDVVLDNAGFSTYQTCVQTRDALGLREAVLITQAFHLDRAVMTCRLIGLDAVGYVADRREYRFVYFNHLREVPATVNALIETLLTRPPPHHPEPVSTSQPPTS